MMRKCKRLPKNSVFHEMGTSVFRQSFCPQGRSKIIKFFVQGVDRF